MSSYDVNLPVSTYTYLDGLGSGRGLTGPDVNTARSRAVFIRYLQSSQWSNNNTAGEGDVLYSESVLIARK